MFIWYDSAAFWDLWGEIVDLSSKQKKLGAVIVAALIAALTVLLNWFSEEESGPLPVPGLPAIDEGSPEYMGPDGEAMLGVSPTTNEEPVVDSE